MLEFLGWPFKLKMVDLQYLHMKDIDFLEKLADNVPLYGSLYGNYTRFSMIYSRRSEVLLPM